MSNEATSTMYTKYRDTNRLHDHYSFGILQPGLVYLFGFELRLSWHWSRCSGWTFPEQTFEYASRWDNHVFGEKRHHCQAEKKSHWKQCLDKNVRICSLHNKPGFFLQRVVTKVESSHRFVDYSGSFLDGPMRQIHRNHPIIMVEQIPYSH